VKYKIGYLVALLALGVGVLIFATFAKPKPWEVLLLIAVLLVPGRIQGLLFRDLFRGRHDLDRNDAASALKHLESFLHTVREQPWRRLALWLSWSIYTPSLEAMAQNNVGAAHLALGDIAAAEGAWRTALELDSQYPLPHANLALVAAAHNDSGAVDKHLATARKLGFRGEGLDRFVRKAQSILATVESHGPTA
jgi:hypothetical protein